MNYSIRLKWEDGIIKEWTIINFECCKAVSLVDYEA